MRYIDLIEEKIKSGCSPQTLIDEGIEYGDEQCLELKACYSKSFPEGLYVAYIKEHCSEMYKPFVLDKFLEIYNDPYSRANAKKFMTKHGLQYSDIAFLNYCFYLILKPFLSFENFNCRILFVAEYHFINDDILSKISILKCQNRSDVDGLSFKNSLEGINAMLNSSYCYKQILDGKWNMTTNLFERIRYNNGLLKNITILESNSQFQDDYKAMIQSDNAFVWSLKKKFLKNEYVFDRDLMEDTYKKIAIVYARIDSRLNSVQREQIRRMTDASISVANMFK